MTTQTALTSRQKKLILVGVLSAMFMASMNSTVVSTALPQVIQSLGGMDLYTWPFTIYMLCTAIVIPIVGRLCDTFGFKPLFFIGIGLFLTGSALCGISASMIQLIIFRGVQGIGAGILSANTLGIIGVTFSPVERARYIGFGSAVYGVASVVGPMLGGLITDHLSWRWAFYINIPIGTLSIIFIFFTLPKIKITNRKKAVDIPGIIVFVLAAVPLLLVLTWINSSNWISLRIISLIVFSLIMFIVFIIIEKKAAQPIIPLQLFKDPIFRSSSISMLLLNGIVIGIVIFIPLFAQSVLGTDASSSGAVLTPLMFSMVLASALCGWVISKTRKYKLSSVLGVIVIIACMIILSMQTTNTGNIVISLVLIFSGIGLGFTLPVFNIAVQNAYPREQVGMVTSVLQFFRLLGTTLFSAIFGSFLTTSMQTKLSNMDFNLMPENAAAFLKNSQSLTNKNAIADIQKGLSGESLDSFNSLLVQVKLALSDTINVIFIICVIVSIISLIAVVLLKELPIHNERETKTQ